MKTLKNKHMLAKFPLLSLIHVNPGGHHVVLGYEKCKASECPNFKRCPRHLLIVNFFYLYNTSPFLCCFKSVKGKVHRELTDDEIKYFKRKVKKYDTREMRRV